MQKLEPKKQTHPVGHEFLTIKEASIWATEHLGKKVTSSNISYLIQYGKVARIGSNGSTQISKEELLQYYESYNGKRQLSWKDQLGEDLNWALSFDQYTEAETTKHVHRLHPYKGKFSSLWSIDAKRINGIMFK